jgi:hypothetical protein
MKNVETGRNNPDRVAASTIGYTRKQANGLTNAARERAIQIKTRGAKNAYKLARTKEKHLSEKRQGNWTKRLLSRLSKIGVFRTLVNFPRS